MDAAAEIQNENFRSKLRGTGYPEILMNSLKRKVSNEQTLAKNVKKPPTFMAKLDQCTKKLMDKILSRGGTLAARIKQTINQLLQV